MRTIAVALFTVFYTSIYSQSIPGFIRYDTINPVLRSNGYFTMNASREEVNRLLQSGAIQFAKALSANNYLCLSNGNVESNNRLQINYMHNNLWKLAPGFINQNVDANILSVRVQDVQAFKHYLDLHGISYTIENMHAASKVIYIRFLQPDAGLNALLNCDEVSFIGHAKNQASEESSNSFQDISINGVNVVHNIYPELNGENFTLSVKENSIDNTDIDLKGRVQESELANETTSQHANQMATIIAGGGNTMPNTKGVVWKSHVASSSFDNLLPDDNAVLQGQGISVQNHSYGVTIENIYGAEARAYDVSMNEDPAILHVFSAGNSGAEVSTTGIYAGIPGYANLTGNMKMAKNILVVGATGKDNTIDARNSGGPAYDGRIKPELVAYGPEGTSDAAAMVSGISALIQHAYQNTYKVRPPAALVKAILIASADDIGKEGIDYISGYGAVNADRAVRLVKAQTLISDTIKQNSAKQFSITVPADIHTLRLAVVWNDPAAEAGDAAALINDLDSKITFGGKQWLPWILHHYPHIDSLALPASRKEDHLNNIEYITIDDPQAGIYTLDIAAPTLTNAAQEVHIAYWLDTANVFRWTYPTAIDATEAGSDIYFRWNTSYTGTAAIEVNIDNTGFTEIAGSVNLADRFYTWTAPEGLHTATARIKIGGIYFTSDEFTIAPSMPLKVGFNCTDNVMLNWNAIPNAEQYQLWKLGEQYLEPVTLTTDTAYIFEKQLTPSLYYAVAPVIQGKTALHGLTYRYDEQGVNCYYSTFSALLTEANVSQLSLELSTTYNIANVTFQKEQDGVYMALNEVSAINGTVYEYTDATLQRGTNHYRVQIQLNDGTSIYTEVAEIYYSDDQTFTVYPNPVDALKQEVVLLTDGDDLAIEFYDANGKVSKREIVYGSFFRFPVTDLRQGLYFYRIFRHAKPVASGRLVVK
ncbi:MAG TPA: S8 family peptidase [Ohtaekwangia sp.]|uniref:S8 family peptidase n=1 Tax=Ohtaekwangia sp. TaxID=2066019 RepID=UPI002F95AEC8